MNRKKKNLNKKYSNNEINFIESNKKLNLLRIQNNQNNRVSKNKCQNSSLRRDCHTPDKNLNNFKFGLTTNKKDNKNNIFLLKSNIKKNPSFIEYHFKNSSKRFLTRSKSKNNIYNNLSNDRKGALTPDKINKTRNIKLPKNQINNNKYIENKRIKEPIDYSKINQTQIYSNFAKSFNISYISENHDILNDSSISMNKRKTPNKYDNFTHYNNYNNIKFNTRLSKGAKLPVLANLSKDKLSRSFCSQNNLNNRENHHNVKRNESYLFSNMKLNRAKKEFNKIYMQNYSKAITRSKSTDGNFNKKNKSNNKLFKNNVFPKQISKNKNNNNYNILINNNLSQDNLNKGYHKTDNNIIDNKLLNTNNFYNKSNNFNFSKKTDNFNYTHLNNLGNRKNLNSNTFLEMAQQKISNKKVLNQKNNKYNGFNNFITKSSTNTNDEINSTNSIISRKNQILDSIEEIHFNFVNVERSSRNLMKLENIEGEKILDNNPNSTVIMLEERDID